MIYLAYDGSLNGDWISRYAIRMACHTPQKKLTLVHISDGTISTERLEMKIDRVASECRACGVELIVKIRPLKRQDVFCSLTDGIPEGRESLLVCGTRVRSRKKGYLSGTISTQLLRHHRFNVIAIRVVQPGLLGNARKLLMPFAGHPRKLESALPFLNLFAPDIEELYLMRIMAVSTLRLNNLSIRQKQALLKTGYAYLKDIADEISERFAPRSFYLDTRVGVSNDWPQEILIHANHFKTHMTLMGACERSLPARFLYYDNALEQILRKTPCDVGVYRSV